MLYTIPDYYRQFHCVAGACEDTCCAGWQIVADKPALRQYKKVTGEYRKEIRAGVDWKAGTFRQDEEKRCYFLKRRNGQTLLLRKSLIIEFILEITKDINELVKNKEKKQKYL